MKRKCCCILAIFVIFFSFGIYARGSKDTNIVEMQSLESWQEKLDISNKKKGKYNIIITAEDIAGNEEIHGPFNMYIDPNSDLPNINISTPADNSRVIGNVNIVGTCVDDDAVDYVELKIDGGEEIYRAKGKEFWSHFINTKDFEEGVHTIEAWGVDVNGVRGKSLKTSFHLDRQQPKTAVQNKTLGSLVSGKITLTGIVQDGNGIDRLLYSLDDGQRFENLKLSYNKKTKESKFSLPINTKKIPDGPKVCWFKAIDKQGSEGIYTFLFFVDNTNPIVEFIYPEDGIVAGSVFSVAGKAYDTVSLEFLTWACGKESGQFEITPGNNYWVKEFDLTKEKSKKAIIEIIAKDTAGNIVRAKRGIDIDKTKDIPKLSMLSPKNGESVGENLYISGMTYDNYGMSEIRYKIDKGEEKIVSAGFGAFGVEEKDVPAGSHTLTIYGVNKFGVKGTPLTVQFTSGGVAPTILFDNSKPVIGSFNVQGKNSSNIYVRASAGLQYVSVGVNGNEETPVNLKQGQTAYIVRLPVSAKSDLGIYTAKITAVDTQNRRSETVMALNAVNSVGSSGTENFVWAVGNKTENGNIIILDGQPIFGVYQPKEGATIANVEVVGDTSFNAEFENNEIKLIAKKDGLFKGVGVKITDSNGEIFESPLIDVYSDMSVPVLKLETPVEPLFVKNSIVLKGSVTDGAGVKSVSYSLGDDSPFVPIKNSFSEIINVADKEDGPILVTIKAEDQAGRQMVEHRIFYKDNTSPEATSVLPVNGEKVNGSFSIAFKVVEAFADVKAEYKPAGKNAQWKTFDYNTLPNVIIGSAAEPASKGMQFRFTDMAGNERIINDYGFEIDNSVDAPVVEIHLPTEEAVIIKDFEISGIVYDDDAPAKLFYKIDNEAYKSVDITNSFSIPVLLADLTDNEHTITVYGEDIYGVKSEPVSRKIKVSLNTPVATVTAPTIADTVKGIVKITGTASDKNGIQKIEVSLNNGNSFSLAEGKEAWSYDINTHVIDDGTHVVFVRATDEYGEQSVFSSLINIDNTPPKIKFEYPLAGSKLDSHLFVSGQTMDNISLAGVTLKIKSLSGTKVPANLAEIQLGTTLLTAKDIDISSLPEGRYNLEITGIDKAKNVGEVSVNFDVYRKNDKERIELLYPLNGQTVRGEFNVYAKIVSEKKMDSATLYVDGKEVASSDVSITSYAAFNLSPELISEGDHKIEVRGNAGGNGMASNSHNIKYEVSGPWITIDNLAMGDFAIERPYLQGRVGYTISEEEKARATSKDATAEEIYNYKRKKLSKVEVSFDNGKTFSKAKLKKGWRYRIESEDMAEGNHFLLVRATMENKEVAICRTIIKIDQENPNITLISPGHGGRYNEEINFVGLASDNVRLKTVKASLRKGDKSSYGVPKFIQGLHVEVAFWGASLWNIGFGLSFFDNNVKVQFHYGQFLQSQFNALYGKGYNLRYGGHIVSLKLLANVYQLPFGYYFGPDWKWLYMNVALGTEFSLFTQTQSKRPQVLSALLLQLEFPKVKFQKQKYFSSFSFFTEGQLWFIPTDVNSKNKFVIKSVVTHLSGGVRLDIF